MELNEKKKTKNDFVLSAPPWDQECEQKKIVERNDVQPKTIESKETP